MFARATRPLQRSLAPLGDRILIRKAVKETKTAGGILLPTDNAKESNEGTVVAVGPGIRDVSGNLHAPTLKAGDTVLLPKYGGTEIEIGDEKLNLFREDDILGKFDLEGGGGKVTASLKVDLLPGYIQLHSRYLQ